jgi:cytochrome c biogenesis protein
MTDTTHAGQAGIEYPPEAVPPPPPRRPGVSGTLRNSWRQLTSMRTALLLLFLLALAAVPGSLLPQRGLNAGKVQEFYAAHPTLAPLVDRLSGFNVFGAPWFAAIYLALFLSLAGCVLPRMWRQASGLRARPPAAPRHLRRLPSSATWAAVGDPVTVVDRYRSSLRGWRIDVRSEPDGSVALAGEKGFAKEAGNLLFHLSLLLLLVGVALGGLFGYKGNVLIKEGDAFSNTLAYYDTISPGRQFSPRQLAPFTVVLNDFRATYQPDGEPQTFGATVSYTPRPGVKQRAYDVRVNHPLQVDGAKLYLIGHGYALHFQVRGPDGKLAYDAVQPFLPRDASFASDGVVKVPDIPPGKDGKQRQLGFSGFFTPTTILGPKGLESGYPAARNPAVTLLAWQGDLGLDNGRPQSVYGLQTRGLHRVVDATGKPATKTLRPGETLTLPGGAGAVTFVGFTEFATFQITSDPGRQLALIAAILLIAGLLVSMRVRRRRIWLRVRLGNPSDGGRTVVEAGGLARNDPESFAEEFAGICARLGAPPPAPDDGHQAAHDPATKEN